jgi:hypothetical protein
LNRIFLSNCYDLIKENSSPRKIHALFTQVQQRSTVDGTPLHLMFPLVRRELRAPYQGNGPFFSIDDPLPPP